MRDERRYVIAVGGDTVVWFLATERGSHWIEGPWRWGMLLNSGGRSSGAEVRRQKAGQEHTPGPVATNRALGPHPPQGGAHWGAGACRAHRRGGRSAGRTAAAAAAAVAAGSAGGCRAGGARRVPLPEVPWCADRAEAPSRCSRRAVERCFLSAVAVGLACSSAGSALWPQWRRCGGGRWRARLPENGASLPGNTAEVNWPSSGAAAEAPDKRRRGQMGKHERVRNTSQLNPRMKGSE